MATTPHFHLTLIEQSQSQSQKEVTANQALVDIDGLLSKALIERESGEFWRKNRLEVTQTLTGIQTSSTLRLPDRAIVFAVHTRVTQAIAGTSNFSVGIAGEEGLFGSGIGIAQDATNIGVITPRPLFADTDVIITADGGSFTTGNVTLVAHYMTCNGPWDF